MALNPRDMDGFMPLLSTTDIKKKLQVGVQLLNFLADPFKSIECQDIGLFIDNLVPWLNSSNPKVVQNGLDALTYLADRMGHDFRPYISTIIQPTIDRLGDNKDATREKAQLMLLKILERGSMSPQHLLDKLQPSFSHKNAKLREEALILLTTTLNEHGADEMALSGAIPSIVKLLSDPTEKVRETAMNTLTDIYRHVGDRLRVDLQRKHNVPQAKLALLVEKFDQLRASGDMLPQARSADDKVSLSKTNTKFVTKKKPIWPCQTFISASRSYWAFKEHFPEQAEALLNSLDATYKRSLMSLSNSGSINSLNFVTKSTNISPRVPRPVISNTGRVSPGVRSTSAIDLQAAQRANARMKYAYLNRQKVTLPSSRSGSPSSRLSYATYNRESPGESLIPRSKVLTDHGMRSSGNSREPSPQRFGYDRNSFGKIRSRNIHMSPSDRPPSRCVMAQKMLQQSREAESALADALTFDSIDSYTRTPKGKGDHSDDSETSSICSERSHDSFRRPSDETALPLIQSRLKRSTTSTPASPGTPPPRIPNSPARIKLKPDSENADDSLNPEEVYRSLRRTTAEIQNYGFERLEKATTSKDSGISNMADVEERLEGLTLSNSVLRMAEKCAATVAVILPPEQTIRFATSMMTTESYPQNMGAIKMLHKVVEHYGRKAIEPHLEKVMPGLLTAYDDAESTVRKSAVFCMVAIHAAASIPLRFVIREVWWASLVSYLLDRCRSITRRARYITKIALASICPQVRYIRFQAHQSVRPRYTAVQCARTPSVHKTRTLSGSRIESAADACISALGNSRPRHRRRRRPTQLFFNSEHRLFFTHQSTVSTNPNFVYLTMRYTKCSKPVCPSLFYFMPPVIFSARSCCLSASCKSWQMHSYSN
ncbi:unnamed protein product [Trichogramma brassicae]|uniref:TOG domain-containing protein n=1 Tax=Trichogramma brassicae TaxID=86971 RepID=A0A6H5IWP2_9HYME|nr:unnamed protein product [Trichogramma brassicae]